jgi:methyl-accepting chemotaxis protein
MNIQMIVSAAEEMTSTINEIAGNTAKGSETTRKAVETAKQVSEKVYKLGVAANEINKVTEAIADISAQTNLLALNATIEAARAGEFGKGFAVVAGEIKALALQTAKATNEISQKIGGVQATTKESVDAIQSIVEIINEIDSIMTTVASAIEEQSAATQEISNNVSQAATGLGEVNENVNQTSAVSGEVTKDIAGVSQATKEMNDGSHQVRTSAAELSKLAEQLNQMDERSRCAAEKKPQLVYISCASPIPGA